MLTGENARFTALTRYRVGYILIWTGVLTWVPFILLRAGGYRPSLFWFLPFHLFGVIGGSRLRAAARTEMGTDGPERNPLRLAGHSMILAGIMVWVVYFYLKLVAHWPVDVARFLPFHLVGVLGGSILLIINALKQRGAS